MSASKGKSAEFQKVAELRAILRAVLKLTALVTKMLKQSSPERGIRDPKRIGKPFEKKDLKLLSKCGVDKKKILSHKDVQRIKSQVDMV